MTAAPAATAPGIRAMTLADYDAVMDLMRRTPGISLRDADGFDATARYLERNPGLSFVCERDDRLVGCVMCGHDGRRGYLQHLLVLPAFRRQGIGRALAARCLDGLAGLGILKCHIDVLATNTSAMAYWEGQRWQLRTDILRYSFTRPDNPNA
jgi:ribosomal protein S18 acetylase RimI-like enzyme